MSKSSKTVWTNGKDVPLARAHAKVVVEERPLCADYDPEMWFPVEKRKPQLAAEAVDICRSGCPRLKVCALQGLAERVSEAVYAGVQVGTAGWQEELEKLAKYGQEVIDSRGPYRRCAGRCRRPLRMAGQKKMWPDSVVERGGYCRECKAEILAAEKAAQEVTAA